ncbi:hypothetical protein EZV62_019500 [Acer yangbiense]|uniref:Uncharacterized protein n=1 Tax=Acer yangbiense TaxID=1000413 RepID=A0A5C7HB73_9ROSI|nr:hypothetical protein EZV62_019500 [Acer yangbiense]
MDQPAVPPRRSPIPIGVPVAPSPPPFATESVHTTQEFRLRPEVPIWDGDNGIQDTFIIDEQERVDANDSYSLNGDEIHESFTKTNFNSFCHEYYSTSWMQTAYAPSINPVPHPAFWEVPDKVASMIDLPPDSKR